MTTEKLAFIHQPLSDTHHQPFPKPHIEAFENPLRIQMAMKYLEENGVLKGLKVSAANQAKLEDALLVHSPYLVNTVEIMSDLGSGYLGESAYASPDLLRSALHALGGAIEATKLVAEARFRHSFALVRPPGHHATTSTSMGLCYFNNMAIATRTVLARKDVERVSILDIDNHFGNGTAEIFYADSNVQYISLHEYDYENFGVGHFDEIGHGDGKGTNINVPLVEGSHDKSFQSALQQIAIPAIESFKPDLIGISAGFDAHYADPVGNLDVDSRTYWYIGDIIEKTVTSLGIRGSYWILEGGYSPFVLGSSIRASLEGLQGKKLPVLEDQVDREEHEMLIESNREIIEKVLETIAPFI
ncbi:MAG: histone deacetylase family protein [Candidatus Thorarchaeota archaeon]